MKRFGWLAVLALLMVPAQSGAYFGTSGIWAEKDGDFVSTNFNGNSSGRDAAYAYLGTYGLCRLGPGSLSLGFGTIPYGVCVVRPSWQGYDIAGRPLRWFDRNGVQYFSADSTGITVVGAAKADSANFPSGVFLGNVRFTKWIRGVFTHDFANVTAASTLDETQTISETGLDAASNWTVFVSPQADMTAGLAIAYTRVSADNTIKIRLINTCGSAADNPSMTFTYVAVK